MSTAHIFQLCKALNRESAQWEQYGNRRILEVDGGVSKSERDAAARWIVTWCCRTPLGVDTAVCAVWTMDKVLAMTRVQSKYARCVAAACLYIASKLCEEEEAVPQVQDLASHCWVDCSAGELIRMERALLGRLEWDLNIVTPYTFLQTMLAIAIPEPLDAAAFLRDLVTGPLYAIIQCDDAVRAHRASLIAFGVIDLAMEVAWRPQFDLLRVRLLELLQISSQQLLDVRASIVTAAMQFVRPAVVEEPPPPPQEEAVEPPPVSEKEEEQEDASAVSSGRKKVAFTIGASTLAVDSNNAEQVDAGDGTLFAFESFADGNRFQPLATLGGTRAQRVAVRRPLASRQNAENIEAQQAARGTKKRQRVKSRTECEKGGGSFGSAECGSVESTTGVHFRRRVKTSPSTAPMENIDDIYDAVPMLYETAARLVIRAN